MVVCKRFARRVYDLFAGAETNDLPDGKAENQKNVCRHPHSAGGHHIRFHAYLSDNMDVNRKNTGD
jgi:hypothetical protein